MRPLPPRFLSKDGDTGKELALTVWPISGPAEPMLPAITDTIDSPIKAR